MIFVCENLAARGAGTGFTSLSGLYQPDTFLSAAQRKGGNYCLSVEAAEQLRNELSISP